MQPDFLIIGAMKCGTSTLQAQLARQQGIFMTTPKEPNFFSDPDIWARGMDWYQGLFAGARPGDLKGEASTHYTKLPTYPECAARLIAALPDIRLVYMTRDPIARLISHYLHEWSMGVITCDLETALERHPELIAYSCYGMQIAPYVEAYGAARICLSSLERIEAAPQAELSRVAAFIGYPGAAVWQSAEARMNVSAERIRRFPGYGLLVDNPVAAGLRRVLVPKALRQAVKRRLQRRDRPELEPASRQRLVEIFARDQARLQALLPEQISRTPA